ncbi:unnamed protein product [Moneuplotes crassus]|uniref:Homeobox domain-containing protein n=1 Tax=Euplotes crassus TaxID=5936 RepID=A0AAD1XP99_EUPCR|nr:unnamed protein product [Moneuplotes crassus]
MNLKSSQSSEEAKEAKVENPEDLTDNNEMKTPIGKKPRTSFSKEQVQLMTSWINSHQENPYPNEIEKKALSVETGLHIDQVSVWFTNTRKRKFRHLKRKGQKKFCKLPEEAIKDLPIQFSNIKEDETYVTPCGQTRTLHNNIEENSALTPDNIMSCYSWNLHIMQAKFSFISAGLDANLAAAKYCTCMLPNFKDLNELSEKLFDMTSEDLMEKK